MCAYKGTFLILQRYILASIWHVLGRKRWTYIYYVVGELIKRLFTKVWARLWKATNDGKVPGARNSHGCNCALDVRPNSGESFLERVTSQELWGHSQHLPPAEDLTPWQWGRKGVLLDLLTVLPIDQTQSEAIGQASICCSPYRWVSRGPEVGQEKWRVDLGVPMKAVHSRTWIKHIRLDVNRVGLGTWSVEEHTKTRSSLPWCWE